MDIEFIEKQICLLSEEWYQQKKDSFISNKFYNKSRNSIYICQPFPDDFYSPTLEGEDDLQTYMFIVDESILDFCWFDKFHETNQDLKGNDQPSLINGTEILHSISIWINRSIRGDLDNPSKYKVILLVLETVKIQIDSLKKQSKDQEYISVLKDFVARFSKYLYFKYSQVFDVQKLTVEYSEVDRLCFNLNQEQLGALLYILNVAKILYNPTDDNSFLHFCGERFYFKNQKQKEFTKAIGLRNKYNDSKKSDSKAKKTVIKLLQDALDIL